MTETCVRADRRVGLCHGDRPGASLDDDDQRFFDRLSVLSGPFTADDAHAVAGEDEPASTIDRHEAEADADLHRADRARAKLDAIVDHLTAALGLGGRARRHTDGVERARSTVTQRIRATIKRLRTVQPVLAAHLEVSVQTGVYCRYRPERPTTWSTAGPAS